MKGISIFVLKKRKDLSYAYYFCGFRSLSPLFDNPKLDRELRCMIREHFGEFCSVDGKYLVIALLNTPGITKT